MLARHWCGIRAASGDYENVKLEVVFYLEDPFNRIVKRRKQL